DKKGFLLKNKHETIAAYVILIEKVECGRDYSVIYESVSELTPDHQLRRNIILKRCTIRVFERVQPVSMVKHYFTHLTFGKKRDLLHKNNTVIGMGEQAGPAGSRLVVVTMSRSLLSVRPNPQSSTHEGHI
ncbi:hypothetical protein MAR_017992, partial [Mya arenaria]